MKKISMLVVLVGLSAGAAAQPAPTPPNSLADPIRICFENYLRPNAPYASDAAMVDKCKQVQAKANAAAQARETTTNLPRAKQLIDQFLSK